MKGINRMKIKFSEQELAIMKKAEVSFDASGKLDDEDLLEIDELVSEYLMYEGMDEEGNVNEEGRICEQILEKLSE